jgi:VanZ family protein
MGKRVKQHVRRILLILWIVTIFVLTGYPKLDVPKIKEFPLDKLYHFFVFFIMGFIAAPLMKAKGFFLLGLFIVLSAECQQLLIPGRDFEILDIMAGVFALIVTYFIFRRTRMEGNVPKA